MGNQRRPDTSPSRKAFITGKHAGGSFAHLLNLKKIAPVPPTPEKQPSALDKLRAMSPYERAAKALSGSK